MRINLNIGLCTLIFGDMVAQSRHVKVLIETLQFIKIELNFQKKNYF
jgi:hypothetical protein